MSNLDCPEVLPIGGEADEEELSNIAGESDEVTTSIIVHPRSVGKLKTVVDTGNYQVLPAERTKQAATPFSHRTERYLYESGQEWRNYQTTLGDRFRFACGTFWGKRDVFTQGERDVDPGTFRYLDSGIFRRENRNILVRGPSFKIRNLSEETPDIRTSIEEVTFLRDFYKKQTIWIEAKNTSFKSGTHRSSEWAQRHWDTWVRGGTLESMDIEGTTTGQNRTFQPMFDINTRFSDHTFQISTPLFPREIQELNGIPRPAHAKVDMEYNFYVKEYELALSRIRNGGMSLESLLPSLYVFLSEKKSSNLDSDQSIFHRMITLNGLIERVSVDVLNDRDEKIGERDSGQYFDKWSRKYPQLGLNLLTLRRPEFVELFSRSKNTIFSSLDMDDFKTFSEKKFLFPMSVQLMFSTDRNTDLAESIKSAQLTTSLIKAVVNAPSNLDTAAPYLPKTESYVVATETVSVGVTTNKTISVSAPQQNVVLDLVAWWKAFKDREITHSPDTLVLGSSLPEVFISEDPQYRFMQTILSLIFSGKIRTILKNHRRTYEDIMNGKLAYSETLFYKISKFKTNSQTGGPVGSPVQDFYVPNSAALDTFNFVDTQVVYGRNYKYVVYAYDLVLGSVYEYKENPAYSRFTRNEHAVVDVYTRPSIQLIETPYLDFATKISDKPPLPPQVEIIPYKGIANEILINLNADTGEIKANPIVFTEGERAKIEEIRILHDLDANAPIEYRGDDTVDYFEVYRTTKKPRTYEDFSKKIHKEVDTEVLKTRDQVTGMSALSSAAFRDTILPNIRYYYTFRTIDIHGNFSNPSVIYSVEMVEESGMSFPVVSFYDFDQTEKEPKKETFKKFIRIAPSVLQTEVFVINEGEVATAADAEVRLGAVDDRLLIGNPQKKKIKIRIFSKQTGKKVDINVFFSHKHTS